jgi:ankyrin repeat protein
MPFFTTAINTRDERGYTPLLVVVSSQSQPTAAVKLLLDNGADPTLQVHPPACSFLHKCNAMTIAKCAGPRKLSHRLPAEAPNEGGQRRGAA